jgi:hypothetical protein
VNSLTPEATICMAVCGHSFRRMAAKRGAARTKTLASYKEAGAESKSLPSRCSDAIVEDRPVRNSDDISVFAVDDSMLTTKREQIRKCRYQPNKWCFEASRIQQSSKKIADIAAAGNRDALLIRSSPTRRRPQKRVRLV